MILQNTSSTKNRNRNRYSRKNRIVPNDSRNRPAMMAIFQSEVPAEKVKLLASFVAQSGLLSRTRDLCRDGHDARKIQNRAERIAGMAYFAITTSSISSRG